MPLLLALLAGIAFWQYQEFQKFQSDYTWKINDISIDYQKSLESNFKFLYYEIIFTIGNPTDFSITLDKINSTLTYKNISLGTFHKTTPTKLLPKTNLRITGKVVIDTALATNAITPLLQELKQTHNLTYQLESSFTVFSFFTIKDIENFSVL